MSSCLPSGPRKGQTDRPGREGREDRDDGREGNTKTVAPNL